MLDRELVKAFGSVDNLIADITAKVVFKGVTYESLNDAGFMAVARKAIPHLEILHEEYDAARAVEQTTLFEDSN